MRVNATFIQPMLLLPTERLPDNREQYEYGLKLDGYRAIAFKTRGRVFLRSRNDKDFTNRYPTVVSGLAGLDDDTVIDGEIVALDEAGKPSFTLLANLGSRGAIFYYVFDVMVLGGRNIMREPFAVRRDLLQQEVLPRLAEPVRYAAPLDAPLEVLIHSVSVRTSAHGT